MKPLRLTLHAQAKMTERGISEDWVNEIARHPTWVTKDPSDPQTERRFGAIAEFGDRILRVVCVETENEIRIVTATFDRRARPQQ